MTSNELDSTTIDGFSSKPLQINCFQPFEQAHIPMLLSELTVSQKSSASIVTCNPTKLALTSFTWPSHVYIQLSTTNRQRKPTQMKWRRWKGGQRNLASKIPSESNPHNTRLDDQQSIEIPRGAIFEASFFKHISFPRFHRLHSINAPSISSYRQKLFIKPQNPNGDHMPLTKPNPPTLLNERSRSQTFFENLHSR